MLTPMFAADFGPYLLEEIVAELGLVRVVRASRQQTSDPLLVHVLRSSLKGSEASLREFRRRQRSADILSGHPRSWKLSDVGTMAGDPYFVLSGWPGVSLAKFSGSADGKLDSSTVPENLPRPAVSDWVIRNWLSDLAGVVDFAHQNGIILGNISPYSIWISDDGSASLMDPGAEGEIPWQLETPDAINATPFIERASYLAPEQLLGWTIGPHTDVYALGAVLHWLLGGRYARSRCADAATIGRYFPLLPPQKGVNEGLAAICVKATALAPSSRFGSAQILRAALLATAEDMLMARKRALAAGRTTVVFGLNNERERREASIMPRTRLGRWLHGWKE